VHLAHVEIGILRALAALHHERRTHEVQHIGVRLEVALDFGNQCGPRLRQRFIEYQQNFARPGGGIIGQRIAQHRVLCIKNILRKQNLMPPTHRHVAFNPGGHARNLTGNRPP